jgi:hypothetical protein
MTACRSSCGPLEPWLGPDRAVRISLLFRSATKLRRPGEVVPDKGQVLPDMLHGALQTGPPGRDRILQMGTILRTLLNVAACIPLPRCRVMRMRNVPINARSFCNRRIAISSQLELLPHSRRGLEENISRVEDKRLFSTFVRFVSIALTQPPVAT